MDRIYKENNQIKAEVPTKDNNVGIRATLNNMGIDNSKIGYDQKSGYVTLNGKSFMKPTYLDDDAGISYASKADIEKSLVDFYKDSNNPVVRVSDAYASRAGKYGLSGNGLSYGNGTVSIGGMPLDTMYIDDSGKAWARQNDIDHLVDSYADRLDVENPNELAARYEREYLDDIQSRITALENRAPFSYNPDEDPVYLAYKEKYLLEGERASRNAMSDYAALTGGYVGSAAVTAGALANQYYAQQLGNKIPELAEQAYQRYYNDYNSEVDMLNRMIDLYDTTYTNAANANKQTAENAAYTTNSIADRDMSEYNLRVDESERAWNKNWTDILNAQKSAGYELDNTQQAIYLEYYRRLLDSQLASEDLSREKAYADIWRIYNR